MPVPLIVCQSISKAFGSAPLFEDLSFAVNEGERLGLIGPNGSGKSTLMRVLAGQTPADTGTVSVRKLARVGYVPQHPEFPPDATVDAVLNEAAAPMGLDEVEAHTRVQIALGRAGFANGAARADTLSGGWRKRLAIAAELIREPDVLLLDEPTNHLDLEGILWLEKLLRTLPSASVVVSHDRYFLENVATAMAELNPAYREGIFRVDGAYGRFLEKKEEYLLAQERRQESLAARYRREAEWLKRGPKARTTKAKARIDAAGVLAGEIADLNARARTSSAQIDFTASDRRTKRLFHAERIAKTLGGRKLFESLNLTLSPGMKIGLAGFNGTGKSTLLRIVLGEWEADAGRIERADNLKIVYFDQNREQLDPTRTLKRALAPEGDSVLYRGRPIHVAGWAKRFLFRDDQLEQPVGRLSGGEQARVLIARLMLQPADILLLDEPTNDLDIPTLEVLEESLGEFGGALVLVTHDRYMLDRVSTAILGLDGEGGAQLYADYEQWEDALAARKPAKTEAKPAAARAEPAPAPKKKLSYLEAREWESMESRILDAEAALEARAREMQEASAAGEPARLQQAYDAQQQAQAEVDRLYARWAELEAKTSA